MRKQYLDEHDITKNMIDKIRGGFKQLIKEADEPTQPETKEPLVQGDDLPEPKTDGDSISPQQGDAVFNDELKKLQDTIDPRVKITNFKIYPTDQNVIIEGVFLQRESQDSGIHFKMSLSSGDIETSMSNIDLDDKVSLLLQKLKGYYENWVNEWALKLTNEYRPKTD